MDPVRLARRLALPVAAALTLAVPGTALATCAGEDAAPTDPAAASATLCLLNAERAAQGLAPLTASPSLAAAAAGHAQDMVTRDFFEHVSPDGGTLEMRLRASGWMPQRGSWSAGEDLAWGSGQLGTPARIVAAWMNSPGHRANILQPSFTQIGIGIAAGAPKPGVQGTAGTYVADFGEQDPPAPRAATTADLGAATTADLDAAKAAIAAASGRPAARAKQHRAARGRARRATTRAHRATTRAHRARAAARRR